MDFYLFSPEEDPELNWQPVADLNTAVERTLHHWDEEARRAAVQASLARLAGLAQRGDKQAYAALLTACRDWLMRYYRRKVQPEHIEDLVQDTLLSLVASVTLSSNDMVRVGDWIEMPSQNADGDVIDEVYRHTGQKDTVLFADAIMALGTLALMFFYAPLLAMLALAALVVTVLTRVAWFGSLQMANVGTITARAERNRATTS